MNEFTFIIVLFPIIFMLHEFEEIICFKPWINKNHSWLMAKYPQFSKLVVHLKELSVSTFAALVLEEFILVSIFTVTALTLQWYNIWIAIFTAFTFHIFIHIVQWLVVRKYIPVIITSFLVVPYLWWGLDTILKSFSISNVIVCFVCGSFVAGINLFLIHKFVH